LLFVLVPALTYTAYACSDMTHSPHEPLYQSQGHKSVLELQLPRL